MSQAAPNLPDDVRQRIEEYLGAIERVLIGGNVSRAERRSIVDEVESQIYDMLATRAEEPAAALTEVLSKLDPPAAYAPESPSKVQVEPAAAARAPRISPSEWWSRWWHWWSTRPEARRISPPALLAACWAGAVVLLFMAMLPFNSPPVLFIGLLALIGLTAPIGVTVLGFMAVRRIRRPGTNEYGLPLALVETFFFPLLLANLALIGVLAASQEAGLILIAALVIIAANVGLARYAWRRFGGQFLSRVDSL